MERRSVFEIFRSNEVHTTVPLRVTAPTVKRAKAAISHDTYIVYIVERKTFVVRVSENLAAYSSMYLDSTCTYKHATYFCSLDYVLLVHNFCIIV